MTSNYKYYITTKGWQTGESYSGEIRSGGYILYGDRRLNSVNDFLIFVSEGRVNYTLTDHTYVSCYNHNNECLYRESYDNITKELVGAGKERLVNLYKYIRDICILSNSSSDSDSDTNSSNGSRDNDGVADCNNNEDTIVFDIISEHINRSNPSDIHNFILKIVSKYSNTSELYDEQYRMKMIHELTKNRK